MTFYVIFISQLRLKYKRNLIIKKGTLTKMTKLDVTQLVVTNNTVTTKYLGHYFKEFIQT